MMRESSNDANNNNAGGSGSGNGGLTFAFLSLGTISVSILLSGVAMHSSMSSTSSSSSSSLAKGIFIGSTSTITLFASGVYFACKFISSGGGTSRSTTSTSAECIEGEFVEKESLIGMNVRKEEMRGWLIFCKGSNMVKANKMSKEKGFAGKTTSKKSSLSLTTLMSGSNTERYYVTLDVKAARMKLEANRGGGGSDGGASATTAAESTTTTTTSFSSSSLEAEYVDKEEKFIDLKQCDVYLVEYPEGNKTELMWNHKRAIVIARRSDASSSSSSLYEGEKVVWLYALSGPSKEAWFYALWRALDMDSMRRGLTSTTATNTNNKQKFPEEAKSRIAQYLLENARFEKKISRSSSNSSEQQQQQQQEKKDEKAKAQQKKQDAFFEHIFDDKRCGQTVNIISSRIFFDLVRSIDFKNVLSNLLEKKLNELPGLPKYVGKFDVEKLSLGEATPKCNMLRPVDGSDGSNAPWDGGSLPGRGVCAAVEADLSYVGLIEVTIRTRVDLAQYAKEIGNLVEGGDAAGVEENDEDAAGKTNDSVTSKSGSRTPTPPLSPTNSGRIPPLNKTKEEVTQNVLKEMKKVVENVNDRVLQKFPLKMTLRVSSCSGTFRFWIPPPPNERLWWGLKGRPRVDIFCEPAIGENKIAHEFIAKKVSHLLSSKLVSDICDELVLPNCASDPMKELIRFEHFVPEIAFEDAIQLSEGNGAFLVTNAASSEDVSSTTYLRGEKKGDEHIVLSKSGSENAFSAQLLPNAPKEEERVEDHQQQQVQEKQEKQQRKSVSLKRENSTKRQEEKNALDATAEWLLSDSHFDSPPTSAAKAPPSSSSQPLSPKSPTGGNNNMIGFGNKREDVLRAKGGGGASSFSSARPTSPDHQNHQNNLFASLSRSIKQKAEENLSKMKSDFQEVQKGLQNGGVEGAVQNIKQIAMKRAKETTTATTTTASTHSSSSSSSQQQRQRQ